MAQSEKRCLSASMGTVDQSRDPLREVDVIVSSARSADTRKYVSISLGGNRYSALLDPGATSSLMHERVAERFRTQMQNCGVFVRSAMCEVSKAIGTLAADLKIEGFQSRVNFRVMSVLDEDVILGMDFCHDFDVDTRWRRGVWRVREGPWRPFLCSDERVKRESCAGITVTNEEQLAEVNRLVEEVLAPQTRLADGLHPMTDLVEHHIRLTDETPIKHKLHRMTEPMLWEARNTMENKAVENVQQEAPIIALDSGENNVTTVENLPLPGLDSSELNLAATMDDVWDDIVATIAENNSTPEIVATAEGGEVSEKVGVTVEFVETEVIAPLLNEQAAPGDGQRDEEVDELTSEQQQVPLQAPMLDQQLEQQQQVPMQEQQLEQQQQVPLQVLMQEQQLEQQQQVPLQVQVQEQQLEPQLRQEQMEANIDSEVVFKKRKRSCRGGRKKKPSANRQLTVDDLELSFDVPARDDEEAGPPNRRQAVGDQVPVYVPSGPASGAGGLTSAEPLASPRQQLQVRLTSVMFGGLKAIPTDPAVDPAPRHCFNCWKPGHFRQVCPSAKERNYCFNCGRVGVDMADCPRCSGAHAEWIERTYSAERSQATEERRRAYESWREANPDRVVSEPRKVEFDLRQRLEQRLVDRQRVLREAGPSSRLDSESRRQEVQRYEPMLKSVRGQRVPEQHSDEARNPASSAGTEAQAADHHATLLEILRRLDGLPDDVRVAAMRSLFQ
ncbi:hypothetical protein TKK_0018798 [Trichogramma kaykai]